MLAEMAATLRHTARTLERTLARLDQLRGAPRVDDERDYRKLRGEAEKQRWHLVVQREAIGFTRSDDIYEQYPLPPPWEAIAPIPAPEAPPSPPLALVDEVGGSRCPRCDGALPVRAGEVACVGCGTRLELALETFGAGPYRAVETVRMVRVLSRPGLVARVVATICVLLSALRR